jgi:hypothetical protein
MIVCPALASSSGRTSLACVCAAAAEKVQANKPINPRILVKPRIYPS